MDRLSSLFVLLVIALALACGGSGSSSGRQLQSIAIQSAVNGQQIQFTANGTFSESPTTAEPLPVNWSFGLFAPPPGTLQYTLTSQPFILDCATSGISGPGVMTAFSPKDPSAPLAGSVAFAQGVTASVSFTCP
jgi:hypothetical protein